MLRYMHCVYFSHKRPIGIILKLITYITNIQLWVSTLYLWCARPFPGGDNFPPSWTQQCSVHSCRVPLEDSLSELGRGSAALRCLKTPRIYTLPFWAKPADIRVRTRPWNKHHDLNLWTYPVRLWVFLRSGCTQRLFVCLFVLLESCDSYGHVKKQNKTKLCW